MVLLPPHSVGVSARRKDLRLLGCSLGRDHTHSLPLLLIHSSDLVERRLHAALQLQQRLGPPQVVLLLLLLELPLGGRLLGARLPHPPQSCHPPRLGALDGDVGLLHVSYLLLCRCDLSPLPALAQPHRSPQLLFRPHPSGYPELLVVQVFLFHEVLLHLLDLAKLNLSSIEFRPSHVLDIFFPLQGLQLIFPPPLQRLDLALDGLDLVQVSKMIFGVKLCTLLPHQVDLRIHLSNVLLLGCNSAFSFLQHRLLVLNALP
mmetsp:Transcript_18796/g.43196  ORF Transcript_18796/g.43196 Transcript_18796/m.43196 type:complete len:260 (+) Transcript_18796:2574-3353(+)